MTSRELYLKTIAHENYHDRAPRALGFVAWTHRYHLKDLEKIWADFPMDNNCPQTIYKEKSKVACSNTVGGIGTAIDSWGCKWTMIQYGITGEIKDPIVTDDEWEDTSRITIPNEQLSFDIEQVNKSCAERHDKFLIGGVAISNFSIVIPEDTLYDSNLYYATELLYEYIKKEANCK